LYVLLVATTFALPVSFICEAQSQITIAYDVVCTGLESHSERWAALALKWAEQLPTSPKLQTALRVLSTNGPTQKLRHAGQNQLAQQGNTT